MALTAGDRELQVDNGGYAQDADGVAVGDKDGGKHTGGLLSCAALHGHSTIPNLAYSLFFPT
mgnify:CR=1 FL=1